MTLDGGHFALCLLCSCLPKKQTSSPFLALNRVNSVFVLCDKSRHNSVFLLCDWGKKRQMGRQALGSGVTLWV